VGNWKEIGGIGLISFGKVDSREKQISEGVSERRISPSPKGKPKPLGKLGGKASLLSGEGVLGDKEKRMFCIKGKGRVCTDYRVNPPCGQKESWAYC